ncbi:unnamed protein product [Schistocephalus solidus]|uniref:Reverse transcriptase domain-containing protein n=1 Tax=Schistocephalus solidus TaxID=70667 RepID=A0A183TAR1_SCHSO|nr:unnamed protein product [Schistocephalus solidus]
MMRQLHDSMMARVMDNRAASVAFAVTNRVKQGCVLAPNLFSFVFYAILLEAYRDESPGIRIAYWMDGRLLKQWRLHSHSRVSIANLDELLFADDREFNVTTEGDVQSSMDLFAAVCCHLELPINTEKTFVMQQLLSSLTYNAARVKVKGAQLQSVDTFTYLDSNL